MNKLFGLVGVAIVYGLINLVLVGGQGLIHSGENKRLDEIKATLATMENQLNNLDSRLISKERNLEQLDGWLEANENTFDIYGYNQNVDRYNSILNTYESDINSYNNLANQYNILVDEGNALIEKIGGTWVVVPIPTKLLD